MNSSKAPKCKCFECDKWFSKLSNLKRHIRNLHTPPRPAEEKINFICCYCSRGFSQKQNLLRHENICNLAKKAPKEIPCCLCSDKQHIPKDFILNHYHTVHEVDVSVIKLKFDKFHGFEQWKKEIEQDTTSWYIVNCKTRNNTNIIHYYGCHRSGFYRYAGRNIRRLKASGSKKINGYCPAKIKAVVDVKTGEVNVEFLPSHVGHDLDSSKISYKKSRHCTVHSDSTSCNTMNLDQKFVEEDTCESDLFKFINDSDNTCSSDGCLVVDESGSVEDRKGKLLEDFQSCLASVNSVKQCEELEAVLKCFQWTYGEKDTAVDHNYVIKPELQCDESKEEIIKLEFTE